MAMTERPDPLERLVHGVPWRTTAELAARLDQDAEIAFIEVFNESLAAETHERPRPPRPADRIDRKMMEVDI